MSTRRDDLTAVLADLLATVAGAEPSAKPALAREIRLLHAELEAIERSEPVSGSVFDELSGRRESKKTATGRKSPKRRVAGGGNKRGPKG